MRNSLILLVLAIATLAILYSLPTATPPIAERGLLFPNLSAHLNDISEIALQSAENQPIVTLKRSDEGWTVAERADFRADGAPIRELLLGLADAQLVEEKTSRPENYAVLGVQDLDSPDATGILISLTDLPAPNAVIVGNRGQGGTFVRRAGETPSWLSSFNVNISRDVKSWLLRDLLDIPATDIQQVTILQTDGEQITISKDSREQTDFSIQNIPEDREMLTATVANPIGNALARLQLDDVSFLDETDFSEKSLNRTEFLTFDGLGILIQSFEEEGEYKITVSARFDEEQAQRFLPTEPIAEEGQEANPAEQQAFETAKQRVENAREQAQVLARQTDGWIYTIPRFRFDNFTKNWDELLKALETPVSEVETDDAPLVELFSEEQ